MDVKKIREQFPIFQEHPSLIYLDSAATTHKPESVINTISNFYRSNNATVHRALYPLGEAATTAFEGVRDTVATFINAANREEIVFTKGATEAINCFAQSWALANLKANDEILLTQAEHHANLFPWQDVAKRTGAKLVFIPVDTQTYGLISPTAYLTPRTKLVAITAESNVIGPLWDSKKHELKTFIAKAHGYNAIVLLDAAQSIAHTPLDVQDLKADAVAFSGHKIFGPTGVGVLYITKDVQKNMHPYQFGGSMIYEANFTDATWTTGAQKFEAGTPPIASVIGLGAAIDFMRKYVDFKKLAEHENALCRQFIDGLITIPGVSIIASPLSYTHGTHVVSFVVEGFHPHDLAFELGHKNISLRAGHHCAQPLVTLLGHHAVLRIGVAVYNTPEDIAQCLETLKTTINGFRRALHG